MSAPVSYGMIILLSLTLANQFSSPKLFQMFLSNSILNFENHS